MLKFVKLFILVQPNKNVVNRLHFLYLDIEVQVACEVKIQLLIGNKTITGHHPKFLSKGSF